MSHTTKSTGLEHEEATLSRDVPPAYDSVEGPATQNDAEEMVAAIGALDLGVGHTKPEVDTCLAHLRLLAAFQELRNEIGYRDGLWDIWDSRATNRSADDANRNATDVLAKLREKRWALYVARAVDRYEAWWGAFVPDMLTEKDMIDPDHGREQRYEGFVSAKPMVWTSQSLPPIDVLLVWHAHMLNPRLYLEDCLRYGHGSLWASGMPWAVVNDAIDSRSKYSASDECRANWIQRTNKRWDNEDGANLKDIKCPACSSTNTAPWTTCGQSQDYKGIKRPGIVGEGYGDGQFNHPCPACGLKITHDMLRVAKFQADVRKLITDDWAIPGTILDIKTGIPRLLNTKDKDDSDQLFPSRLARRGLLVDVADMLKPESSTVASMSSVRDAIETFTGRFADPKKLKHVEDKHGVKKAVDVRLHLTARQQTRRMMSRYWENSSPFSINLCGCVLRQGMFTNKMGQLNWLHLPTNRDLMQRLLIKYDRFFKIMGAYPDEAAVPTLDVDLAWHTHQLSPKDYFEFAVSQTKAFTDHNDRVDEEKLGQAFEWTSKIYQEKYGEVYSECRCWYCETTRVMHLPTVSKLFSTTKEEKFLETWHSSGASQKHPRPPEAESAHVSAHPAVQTQETTARRAHTRPLRLAFRNKLEESHSKARKRANKSFKTDNGKRMGPRGEDKVDFWGKEVKVHAPFASATAAAATAAIYPAPPGTVNTGNGSVGSCATGTCGGSGGCGSETVGMCTAGCVGSGWFGGKSGCTGYV